MHRGPVRHGAAMTWCATLVALLTSCGVIDAGQGENRPAPEEAPSSSQPTGAARESGAKREVLAVVENRTEAYDRAAAKGDLESSGLERYIIDKAYAKDTRELLRYRDAGVVFEGRQKVSDTRVTRVNVDTSPRTATVRQCVDGSDWKPVRKKSGEAAEVKRPPRRYAATYQLRAVDTGWQISDHRRAPAGDC